MALTGIREKLGVKPYIQNLPIGAKETFKGVVNILENKAYFFDDKGGVTEGPVPDDMHLPDEIRLQLLKATAGVEAGPAPHPETGPGETVPRWREYRRRALDEAERSYLRELLRTSRGNVVRASKISGLSPSRLYDLFRKYGLPTRP